MNFFGGIQRRNMDLVRIGRYLSTGRNPLLAGHSKWANIRHTKAAKDEKRAVLFRKFGRQIQLAIQDGGNCDLALNSQLRNVVQEALKCNMPMITIRNIIKKSQEASTANVKRYRLDFRYKQKVFLIVIAYTDNYSVLRMNVTAASKKAGASIIEATNIFDEFGLVRAIIDPKRLPVNKAISLEELATEDAIECGVEEVEVEDASQGVVNFICSPGDLITVRKNLCGKGYTIHYHSLVYTPNMTVQLSIAESKAYEKFLDKLREIASIEEIYDNVDDEN